MAVIDLANPTRFLRIVERVLPWLIAATVLAFAVGLARAISAPDDYQQGATVKIMFLHVPAAWLGMLGWGLMSVAALGTLVWRHPLADVAGKAAAPIGAAFTFICLVTGSLWGRPTWGTYWVWDARLTSMLVLLLLYLGVMALYWTAEDPGRGSRAAAVLTLVGAVNLPIIKFSVDWWNTLHQGEPRFSASAARPSTPSILWPLAIMALRLHAAVLHLASRRHAQRDPAPARAHDAADAGAGVARPRMNLGPHADFIVAAYAVTAFVVAAPDRPGSFSIIGRSAASSAISRSAASRGVRSARAATDHEHGVHRNARQDAAQDPGAAAAGRFSSRLAGLFLVPASAAAIPRAFPPR